ncbi:ATP-binding protein [Horticoccus sp. 23ND18S-11]|uniref:ATP-binding protein n=1 Tax=Horticoccus sp. 23ND18S-11 TaxID=3391832 RepID=UPI0039C9BE39
MRVRILPRPLLRVLLFLGVSAAVAQPLPFDAELGRPLVRNWTMRDYEGFAQNWVGLTDADGRVYIGNRDGVLMYDGQAWRVLPVPGLFIRGLAFAADGRLYVGGTNEIGYFDRTPLGEWGPYVSLIPQVPAGERDLGDSRHVHVLPDGVYFTFAQRLLRWRDGRMQSWPLTSEWGTYPYRVGDRLYLHRLGDPLRVVVGDEIQVFLDRPEIRAARLGDVIAMPEGGLLLTWLNGRTARWQDGQLKPWAEASAGWLREQGIIRTRRIGAAHVAVMTERNGVVLFDLAGNFLQRIDVAAGLYNPIVRDVVLDAEGGLWFAMNHGVAHVDALAGISFFDGLNGLGRSTVREMVRHQGRLVVATAEGVFHLRPGEGSAMARFELLAGSEGDTSSLYSHASGLLVGTRNGLFLHPPGGGRVKLADLHCNHLQAHPARPDLVWLSTAGGSVQALSFDGQRWNLGVKLATPGTEPRTLAALADGSLWVSTMTRGLFRWAAPLQQPAAPPEVFFESDGLPVGHNWMRIDRWGEDVIVSSRPALMRWDPGARRFLPFPVANRQPSEGSMNLHGGDPRVLWSFFGSDRRSAAITRFTAGGAREALPQIIVQSVGDVESLLAETHAGRDVLWVGGSFGLVRVVLADAFRPRSEFKTVLGPIDRTFEPRVEDRTLIWPHGQADIAVRFAATTFRSGSHLQFQNFLEGYDQDWGPLSSTASRQFTNLSAGRYTLRVRARDADGRMGREATLALVVLPPWWQTGWAYVAGIVGVVGLIGGIVRWRVRAGERERERLQQLVTARTGQLVESQRSLLQAKEAAEAANRAKSAFLASMSHELRTPLNSVLGYAQILRRSPEVGPNARRSLDTIQRSGDHLLNLINEVLDLAKVESGRMELNETSFALGRFAQSITELFAVRAVEKGLAFTGPDPATLATRVIGDESRLRQVVVNLLGNAFKFTDQGGIAWSLQATNAGRWRIEVKDTGIGIAPTEQAKVFEAFYQSSAAPALAQQGTGLGLSISFRLVQLMGGQLELESAVGAGSRFSFEIPLRVDPHAPPVEDTVAADAPLIVGYHGPRRRLLIVDDERANRAILAEILGPLGFIVAEADGAVAARAAIQRQAPDAVLLDLRMPGDDGFTLAREWRADGTLVGGKVLALSASVLPEQQAEALAAGCDAFLAKPFRVEHLLGVIGSLLAIEWITQGEAPAAAAPATVVEEVRWEAGLLQRLLHLAERGDALRLGQELSQLARRGTAWAALVAPWQKLAGGYQMEALSRALGETQARIARAES